MNEERIYVEDIEEDVEFDFVIKQDKEGRCSGDFSASYFKKIQERFIQKNITIKELYNAIHSVLEMNGISDFICDRIAEQRAYKQKALKECYVGKLKEESK